MSSWRGGIYVIRCDKPGVVLGLPVIGRHWAYVGMSNSYFHREQQHFYGSRFYGTQAKQFSDLRPKFYKVMPLPDFFTHNELLGRRITWLIETAFIWLLIPVYNVRQQPPYNLRKISPYRANAQKRMRDEERDHV